MLVSSCKAACTMASSARCSVLVLPTFMARRRCRFISQCGLSFGQDEFLGFCDGKDAVLVVEEGQPNYIEQAMAAMLHKADHTARIIGKEVMPMAGEYTGQVMLDGSAPSCANGHLIWFQLIYVRLIPPRRSRSFRSHLTCSRPSARLLNGCPERPIFAATKLIEQQLGPHHIASDIGCHLFSIMPPFELGATTMGYGLGPASASAFNSPTPAWVDFLVGDGGFWHNGLTPPLATRYSTAMTG